MKHSRSHFSLVMNTQHKGVVCDNKKEGRKESQVVQAKGNDMSPMRHVL